MEDRLKRYYDKIEWFNDRADKLDALGAEIKEMLRSFNTDKGNEVVTYKDLSALEYDVPYHVNDKVMFVRIRNNDPNKLTFHTYMKAGGVFGKQSHDTIEQCEIVKGKLIEAMRHDQVYFSGETVTYDKFEVHKPYTDVESVYHVTFKKDVNLTPSV